MNAHASGEADYQRWLAAEIERRRALTQATGVDHLNEWLKGVQQGQNPKDERQAPLL